MLSKGLILVKVGPRSVAAELPLRAPRAVEDEFCALIEVVTDVVGPPALHTVG
jgi:hypothetical protein